MADQHAEYVRVEVDRDDLAWALKFVTVDGDHTRAVVERLTEVLERSDAGGSEYQRGLAAGLERAKELVMGAPVLLHGRRHCAGPGGFPRVVDRAVDADGDPDDVWCSYALRDAVLHWIDKDQAALTDGRADASDQA